MGASHAGAVELLSNVDFEIKPTEMPTTYTLGTGALSTWEMREGSTGQTTQYLDDGFGNHFVLVGSSVNQNGTFQVVDFPTVTDLTLSFDYSNPSQPASVGIYGTNAGSSIAKFAISLNDTSHFTLLGSSTPSAVSNMTHVEVPIILSGSYDYLVVSLKAGSFDNVSLSYASVPEPATVGLAVGLAALGVAAMRRKRARC